MSRRELLFSFEGRIKRSAWWGTTLAIWLIGFFSVMVVSLIAYGLGDAGTAIAVLLLPLGAVWLWCSYAVSAKSWHDRNKSGWWSLITLVPCIGAIWILIELGFLRGTEDANKFGPEPWTQ